jgi:hypothetical protein
MQQTGAASRRRELGRFTRVGPRVTTFSKRDGVDFDSGTLRWGDYFIHLLDVQKELLPALVRESSSRPTFWWPSGAGRPDYRQSHRPVGGRLDQLVRPATPIPPAGSYTSELHLRVHVNRTPPPKRPFQYANSENISRLRS